MECALWASLTDYFVSPALPLPWSIPVLLQTRSLLPIVQASRATTYVGASDALRESIEAAIRLPAPSGFDLAVQVPKNMLGQELFAVQWLTGRELRAGSAVAIAFVVLYALSSAARIVFARLGARDSPLRRTRRHETNSGC